MDLTTVIRIIGAMMFVVAVAIIVARRKRMSKQRHKVG
jgi:hypothetical protein